MVGNKRANRAIGMGDSTLMTMEYMPRYREKKTNQQKRKKLFFHQPISVGQTQVHYMASN
jgi:hypothetical protein